MTGSEGLRDQSDRAPEVGSRWRNKHTGKTTTVLVVEPPKPFDLHYDPLVVRFEGCAAPGFSDRYGGWGISAFLAHWERVA